MVENERRLHSLLIGEYEHSLDAKGRIIMPSKFRDDLGDKFIVTKGLDGCLFAFSKEEWTKFEEKLSRITNFKQRCKNFH